MSRMKLGIIFLVVWWSLFIGMHVMAGENTVVKFYKDGKVSKVEVLLRHKNTKNLEQLALQYCNDEGTLVLIKYHNRILYGTKCWEDD